MRYLLISALLLSPLSAAAQTITVSPGTSHQTMGYWEAVGEAGREDFSDWDDFKDSLLDQMRDDGINRIKISMKANTEAVTIPGPPVNDNADPFVIDSADFNWTRVDYMADMADLLCDRLAAQGKACKKVLGYVDFLEGSNVFHTDDVEELAELFEAAFIHLNATYGWVPDVIEVILEPDHGSNAHWTTGATNYTKLVNAILAIQSRLDGHGWNPRFLVPSVTNAANLAGWWAGMKAVNTTWLQYVDEGSYHRYGSPSNAQLDANQTAVEADGKRLAMLEFADLASDYTLLHADLKRNMVSYEQFTATYDDTDNGNHYYRTNHTTHVVLPTSRFKFIRQYFKWIQPGAVRKGTSSNDGNLDGLAFQNTGGNYTIVVKALAAGDINATGMPAGTYNITWTTAAAYNQTETPQVIGSGGTVSTAIPAAGVLTIYADAPVQGSPRISTSGRVARRGRVTTN